MADAAGAAAAEAAPDLTAQAQEAEVGRERPSARAVDLELSLLASAARSYRWATVLHPFPTPCGPRAETAARENVLSCLRELDSCDAASLDPLTRPPAERDLLTWLFRKKNFVVRECAMDQLEPVLAVQFARHPTMRPHAVFEIVYDSSAGSEAFVQEQATHGSEIAFHGTSFENIYSIVHHGFCTHMNKTALFGGGTYLARDVSVCANFMKAAAGWQGSRLGTTLSAVLACDVICHPSLRRAEPGMPTQYILVPNNDWLRPRYVLLYRESRPSRRLSLLWILFFFYLFCLLLAGLLRSRWASRAFRAMGLAT